MAGLRPHLSLETGNRKLATEFFDIVWDDPPTPLYGYAATNPAVCAGSSRAEAPSGAKAGPQAHNFPVVIGEGSHPFPFRTRKLSSLPPMVLHG